MAGLFDDLIPTEAPARAAGGGIFDDLIPPPKREVGVLESLNRGYQQLTPTLASQAALVAYMPFAGLSDALSGAFSGRTVTEDQDTVGNFVTRKAREAAALGIDPATEQQSTPAKIATAAPSLLFDLASAIATGGESAAVKPALTAAMRPALSTAMRGALETGVKASVIPGARIAEDRAKAVIDAGGTPQEAIAAGAQAYAATTATNAVPVAATGGVLSRALQGAVAGAPLEYAQRELQATPATRAAGLDTPMTAEDALLSTIFSGGLAAGLGGSREAPLDQRGDTQALKERAAAHGPGTDKATALADFLDLMQRGERPEGFRPDAPPAAVPEPAPPPLWRVPAPRPAQLAPEVRPEAAVAAEPPLLDRAPPPDVRHEPPPAATAPAPAQEVSAPVDLTPDGRSRSVRIGPSSVTYAAGPDGVKLNFLGTPKKAGREAGSGEAALKGFLAQTDAAGQPVTLVVEPQGAGIDPARLEGLYARNGFVRTGETADGAAIMRREPLTVAPPAPPAPLPKPKTLLQQVAKVGLNREAFRQAGVHPDYFLTRAGIGYVFRKEGGLTPDGLREKMQQDGFLPPDDPNAPPTTDNRDAVDLLQDALDGKDVYSYADADAAAAIRAQRHEELQREVPDIDPADLDEAAALLDEAEEARDAGEPPEDFFARYAGEPNPEVFDGPEPGAGEKGDRVGVPQAAAPSSESARVQAGLFPPATAREAVGAAARARDDERNGRTGTGRTDMLAGKGELFAGPAPEQARIATPSPAEPRPTTSLKNEVMQAEREARGEEPLPPTNRQSNDDTLERAKADLAANPSRGAEVVQSINGDVHGRVSLADQAVLLVHKQNVMQARDRAADRAGDPNLTPDQRAVARREFDQLEGDLHSIDEATKAIGTESGRLLQLRTRLLRDDFTFEAMERKERAILGRPLTAEESATIKKQAERIAKLEAEAEARKAAEEDATVDADAATTYRNLVAEMAKALRPDGGAKKRPILETLKRRADESRAALAALPEVSSRNKQSGAVINPVAFLHLANIGAYHIANGAAKLADWVGRMKADLGAKFGIFEDAMPSVFEAAKAQHAAAARAGKPERAPADVIADIDPEKLTHRDVYNLARAHVLAGVHGEGAVMKATHADLVKLVPGLTERDVRRLFSDYGKAKFPSKAADKVELRELRALVQLQESIDRLEEGRAALKSGQQRDPATQAIRDKRKHLNNLLRAQERKYGASPERLATYQDARATNLRNQIEDLERELRTGEKREKSAQPPEPNAEVKRLQAIRDSLKKQLEAIEAARNPPKSPEERYQESRAKSLEKQLNEVRARIARGDYSRAVRPPPKALNAANKKAAFELAKAKQDIALHQFMLKMEGRSPLRKALGTAAETLNLSRAVMTSLDLSAVLRQGGFIVLGHPRRAARSILPMLKAVASEKQAFEVDDEIANRPNFELYRKAGLYLSEQNNHLPSKMEEAYLSRWLQKTEPTGGPVKRAAITAKNIATAPIRASGRAFTTFLNKLRADSFDAMAASLSSGSEITMAEAKALANYINVATGRGKIGTKQQAAVGLNTIFFAPKLVASRFNLLGGQPLYGGTMRTRSLIAQDYARFLGGVATTIGLAALAHDEEDGPLTTLDPRSADFLKIRFGKTFLDPMTGLAQVTTFLAREATGEKVTTTGKLVPIRDSYRLTDYVDWAGEPSKAKVAYGGDDGLTIAGRFARTKFAPIPGAIANLIAGEDVTGQPVDAADTVTGLVTPLSFRNIFDVMREQGVPAGPAILTLEMLGMGVQYRQPREDTEDKPAKGKYH